MWTATRADQSERTAAGNTTTGITRYYEGILGVEATKTGGADINDIDRDPASGQPLVFTVAVWHEGVRHDLHYYLTDALGSVVGLVSATGAVTAAYAYDPYGQQLDQQGPAAVAGRNHIRYAGGIGDPNTDLIKFGVRYYDPATGRWTQQDTLNVPLDPTNANRYAYAANNPINYTDPTGNITLEDFLSGASVGLGLGAAGAAALGLAPASIGLTVASGVVGAVGGYIQGGADCAALHGGIATLGGITGGSLGVASPIVGALADVGTLGAGLATAEASDAC